MLFINHIIETAAGQHNKQKELRNEEKQSIPPKPKSGFRIRVDDSYPECRFYQDKAEQKLRLLCCIGAGVWGRI